MKRRRNFGKQEEAQNFWPSFTDMISTIALILFFLMILAYVQNIVTGSNLEYAKKQLVDTEQQLEASNAEISQAEKQLRLMEDELDDIMAEVRRGEIALKLSEDQIEDQQEIIAESNKELGKLRSRLNGMAIFRVEVLEKVKESIEDELGKTNDSGEPLVAIANNGNIVINESLVFDSNSYEVKDSGKAVLTQLAKAFENILDDRSIRQNIDAINIQGHTDQEGAPEYNRELSAKRATSVVNYMLNANETLEKVYGKYFAASGYSEFRPIDFRDTEEAMAKNRRIEISLILKDASIQKLIDAYLEESMTPFEEREKE